jgi:hypothetical protein
LPSTRACPIAIGTTACRTGTRARASASSIVSFWFEPKSEDGTPWVSVLPGWIWSRFVPNCENSSTM